MIFGDSQYVSIGTSTITTTAAPKWQFCPGCGKKLEPAWNYCSGCGKAIGSESQWAPYVFPHPYPTTPTTPVTIMTGVIQRCAFDGLPPGVYGLVCTCPRCSPRM